MARSKGTVICLKAAYYSYNELCNDLVDGFSSQQKNKKKHLQTNILYIKIKIKGLKQLHRVLRALGARNVCEACKGHTMSRQFS